MTKRRVNAVYQQHMVPNYFLASYIDIFALKMSHFILKQVVMSCDIIN